MRVISGSRKGTRLASLKGNVVRPTADSTKELIFNVLAGDVAGCSILDLYAGTGGLGIEALSRGAAKAIFVDKNFRAVNIIRENLIKTSFTERAEIMKLPAEKALQLFSDRMETFDIIFADPPYDSGFASATQQAVERLQSLKKGGWLIIEHRAHTTPLPPSDKLILKSKKRRGDTVVTFLCYE